jgi:hypothetical protein
MTAGPHAGLCRQKQRSPTTWSACGAIGVLDGRRNPSWTYDSTSIRSVLVQVTRNRSMRLSGNVLLRLAYWGCHVPVLSSPKRREIADDIDGEDRGEVRVAVIVRALRLCACPRKAARAEREKLHYRSPRRPGSGKW